MVTLIGFRALFAATFVLAMLGGTCILMTRRVR
jgi:hypothetical protein